MAGNFIISPEHRFQLRCCGPTTHVGYSDNRFLISAKKTAAKTFIDSVKTLSDEHPGLRINAV